MEIARGGQQAGGGGQFTAVLRDHADVLREDRQGKDQERLARDADGRWQGIQRVSRIWENDIAMKINDGRADMVLALLALRPICVNGSVCITTGIRMVDPASRGMCSQKEQDPVIV